MHCQFHRYLNPANSDEEETDREGKTLAKLRIKK